MPVPSPWASHLATPSALPLTSEMNSLTRHDSVKSGPGALVRQNGGQGGAVWHWLTKPSSTKILHHHRENVHLDARPPCPPTTPPPSLSLTTLRRVVPWGSYGDPQTKKNLEWLSLAHPPPPRVSFQAPPPLAVRDPSAQPGFPGSPPAALQHSDPEESTHLQS